MVEDVRLTQFAKGSGCGCKIAPAVLQEMLSMNKKGVSYKNLLVGNSQNDDAAVYDLENGMALIVTADFFTPIVDDPYRFGMIAAANALSDVYAMGGKPITAIAILGWPVDKIAPALARKVMEGAEEICEQAGITISGGHTIDAPEPFFGLSVNGLTAINCLKKNATAHEGDLIMISKPIGVGIIATAHKRQLTTPDQESAWLRQLTELNHYGADLGSEQAVHAMTDTTGFGLLGHLCEMAEGAGLTAEINYSQLPVLAAARTFAAQGILPDATFRNWNSYAENVAIHPDINAMESFALLPDPQTNGGLLIAVDSGFAEAIQNNAAQHQINLTIIGKFKARDTVAVQVNP